MIGKPSRRAGTPPLRSGSTNRCADVSCTVVLVGSNTAGRKWINYEIDTSWKYKKGVVGIYIHGLKNQYGETAAKGDNPFDYIDYSNTGKKLSSIVECHNPSGSNSQERYAWIEKNLADIVQKAIVNRDIETFLALR